MTLETTFQGNKFRKINRSVYGLVQASKNFYDEITIYLKTKDFKIYEGEPCLLNKEEIYFGLYVDALLIICPTDQVNVLLNEIKERFEVLVEKNIKEFVGCELIINDKKLILNQRKIIMNLLQDFNLEIKDLKFKGCPMGNLIKVTSPLDVSQDIL